MVFLLAVVLIFTQFNISRWKKEVVIQQDIIGYYSYLPAAFIFHDLTMSYANGDRYFNGKVWGKPNPAGGFTPKYTCGMAIAYMPFFWVAHATATIGDYVNDGYSLPYQIALVFSGAFFAIIGLVFLRKVLLLYYSEWITALTLIVILMGTNLYYYATTDSCMPHATLFGINTLFIWAVINFFASKKWKWAVAMGATLGLSTLIRPTQAIWVLLPAIYGVINRDTLRDRGNFLLKNATKIVFASILAFLFFFIQMLYWKTMEGSWLHYSYVDERFFFHNPQITNVLFSYRKGWLLYTPVMLFALAGIPFLWFKIPKTRPLFIPVLFIFVISTWIISSWWSWWYGGGFGGRPFIDFYGLLAIPMAASFAAIWNLKNGAKGKLKFILIPVLLILIAYNCFQTLQARYWILHYSGMTKEAYWKIFLKTEYPPDYDQSIQMPDEEKAKLGEKEY